MKLIQETMQAILSREKRKKKGAVARSIYSRNNLALSADREVRKKAAKARPYSEEKLATASHIHFNSSKRMNRDKVYNLRPTKLYKICERRLEEKGDSTNSLKAPAFRIKNDKGDLIWVAINRTDSHIDYFLWVISTDAYIAAYRKKEAARVEKATLSVSEHVKKQRRGKPTLRQKAQEARKAQRKDMLT